MLLSVVHSELSDEKTLHGLMVLIQFMASRMLLLYSLFMSSEKIHK